MGEYRIPELIEVINILPNEIFLNIELKGEETAKKVNEIITEFINKTESKLDRFIISSFNWNELENFRSFNSEIPIAILTDTNPLNAIPVAKKLNAVAINPNYKLLNKYVVNQIKKEGLKIFPYTVNSINDIDKMKNLGVDGIITNYPERIK
jgi:glycerophosphoryl diester phosphodiesterase